MDNNKRFDSLAISASAGCGKTQEMAIRLLGMFLTEPDAPEKIFNSTIAATFSRSGAKEIYSRVLELIFDALLDNKLDELNKNLQELNFAVPVADRNILLKLLRKLIFAMNELKICTIDSFMSKIVSTFSTELGLPRKTELISAGEEQILKLEVLKKLFVTPENYSSSEEDKLRDLALDSKKSTYGKTARKYHEQLKGAINSYQRMFDDNPDAETYKVNINAGEIFSPDKISSAWDVLKDNRSDLRLAVTSDKASLYDVMKKISEASTETYFSTEELNRMRDFFSGWHYVISNNLNKISGFSRESFTDKECMALQILLYYAAYILLVQNSIRSEGALALSRNYRKLYAESFYSHGKITFADLPRLLGNNSNDWTYDIAYRLNNKFSYYLLDEFQDTSRLQWAVLDSIFGTPEQDDDKSMFIVGDIKQAIYGWRSGDRRLMHEVTAKMENLVNMENKPLDRSYRYGQNICSAINHIFGDEAMKNGGFFAGAGEEWAKVFKQHVPADVLKYRSLFEAYWSNNDKKDNASAYAEVILEKIKEYNIDNAPGSCAILVRTNPDGIALLKELQKNKKYGDIFMWEGNKKISNDKIITALLHLLIYIQHPAETISKAICEMLPVAEPLIPHNSEAQMRECSRLNQDGFYKYLKNCVLKLKKISNMQNMSFKDTESIELFLLNAAKFDRSSVNKDAELFKKYIEEVSHSEEAIGNKIRIMTIHHSKGLTFDHVFAAFFSGENVVRREKNIPVAGKYANGNKWILNSVNDEMLLFPEIKKAWDAVTIENIFEDFCTAYVALSRAKYTMTLLLPPLADTKIKKMESGKKLSAEKSYSFTDYMTEKLFADSYPVKQELFRTLYHFSSMKIDEPYCDHPVCRQKKITAETVLKLPFTPQAANSLRRRHISPSNNMNDDLLNNVQSLYFNLPDISKGKDFGIELHEFLCSVKDFSDISFPANCHSKVRNEVTKLVNTPEIFSLLQDFDECFNELNFDIILDDTYVSGCFDRVQIHRDANKKISGAIIIDYKSGKYDASSDEKRIRYHNQLKLYAKALSQLLMLDINKIKCYIIATEKAFAEEVEI